MKKWLNHFWYKYDLIFCFKQNDSYWLLLDRFSVMLELFTCFKTSHVPNSVRCNFSRYAIYHYTHAFSLPRSTLLNSPSSLFWIPFIFLLPFCSLFRSLVFNFKFLSPHRWLPLVFSEPGPLTTLCLMAMRSWRSPTKRSTKNGAIQFCQRQASRRSGFQRLDMSE